MNDTDIAYIAGLFDGEGCVSYKQYMQKRKGRKKAYPFWQSRLEIAMTEKSILVWLCEVLGVGTVTEKRYKIKYTLGWKKQWRWRCSHRDAFKVCCLIFPYAHIKLAKIQKIIQHYSDKKLRVDDNVINLEWYKTWIASNRDFK